MAIDAAKASFMKAMTSVLFKNTFIYTLLQVINKGVPFLLLPVLTVYLTTADYGVIAMFNTTVGVLGIFIGLSLSGAVGVNYFQLNHLELRDFIGNVIVILLLTSALAGGVVFLANDLIVDQINIPSMWIYIAVAVALTQVFTEINLTIWRSQQKAKHYAWYSLSQTALNIGISLALILVYEYGWAGRTTGTAVAMVSFGLLSLIFLYQRGYLNLTVQAHHIKDALKFGVPLIPHQMALWMRSGADIFLITMLVGVSETGLYAVGYQVGAILGILAHAFNNAYSPYLYEKLKNISEEEKIKIVKFTYLYFVLIMLAAVMLAVSFAMISPYFLGESFQNANEFIIWIAVAHAFQGMYLMVVNYIFYCKKNHLISMATISMSIFHVFLSYFFIQYFGAVGAAYATVISFLCTFLLIWRISNKVYDMPWFSKGIIGVK